MLYCNRKEDRLKDEDAERRKERESYVDLAGFCDLGRIGGRLLNG